jgi:hypothetical protein
MLLRTCSLRPGPEVRSYSIFLLGGLMLFGFGAAFAPLGAARALSTGHGAEAALVLMMGLLMVAGAYAFAKAYRRSAIVCRREGARLQVTTAQGPHEAAAGEASLFVRKVVPPTQHGSHHEVCLRLPQRRDSVVLCESLLARRAWRQAERVAAHLDLAITREPEVELLPGDWQHRE